MGEGIEMGRSKINLFTAIWLGFFVLNGMQHCFICRRSDSTVSDDALIEPRTMATSALEVR
jgi:hypothetical protein